MVSRRHSNSARPARGPVNVEIGRLNEVIESAEQPRHRPLVGVVLQPLATRFCARAHLAVYPKRPSSSYGRQWPHKAAAAVDFTPVAHRRLDRDLSFFLLSVLQLIIGHCARFPRWDLFGRYIKIVLSILAQC
jgi:hypothetical protein